jgi:hypothetical protein
MFVQAHKRLRFDRYAAQCESTQEMNSPESKTSQKTFSPISIDRRISDLFYPM